MFVGEAPGANEDRLGRPFVGRAGMLLEELLAATGLVREDVWITNVVKARPPKNRDPRAAKVARADEDASCENSPERA
jgi:uracil-DNA glycosylase family 4